MKYGIIFWGNSVNRDNVLKLQKRTIRVIMNSSNRTSCHELFKKLDILPLQSQYILSLELFVIKNMELFSPTSDTHTINTENKSNLYPPQSRLTKCQKGVYSAGIKIVNHLPKKIKKLSGDTNKQI